MSKISRSSEDSLVDRGANGNVASIYVRFRAKNPYSTVDIRSADNHEIIHISLVTAGRVTLTTSGEVILIMHQQVYHGKKIATHPSAQIEFYNK